ncbi:putative acyltransferase [Cellulosimicrobium cellulans]|uniref:Heparan-alpha-glucosaminide N-acetyltransferase catalytic domain-containing protein n=1 Tax=Cellulosimicrobium cellulans TaxID=1710 RepID=A0A1Y0HXP2_CELCE|nr:heparan-alpha-glucosaminide N-acetyltransferase domain-containing protein [Cellulosimicrobium cellulans]ARU52024.1 hypothetical protein CBR64_11615 [Cellulosimicrobium cellulans]MBM7818569.1 putative acyltransferase [Cellulosimicrobium cellulans]
MTTALRTRPSTRIAALDWLRGIMLVASVTINSMVILPPSFHHSPWDGVNLEDVIFPIFVTLSGCGLAFALNRRTDWPRFARRVVVLFGLGLVYNWVVDGTQSLGELRFTGVLQLYAVVVLLTALGHQLTRTWRGWLGWTAFYASTYSALLMWWSTRCPDSTLTRECNPSGAIDSAVFGSHMYAGGLLGHDPEGLVAIYGSMVSVAAGATIGHLVLAIHRRSDDVPLRRYVAPLTLLGAGLLAAAWLLPRAADVLGTDLPMMKRLWTPPFALAIAGGVAIAMGLAVVVTRKIESRPVLDAALLYWLVALGRNSLLVYFGSHVLSSLLRRYPGGPGEGVLFQAVNALGGGWAGQIAVTLALLLFWTTLAVVLHRRRIYLTA